MSEQTEPNTVWAAKKSLRYASTTITFDEFLTPEFCAEQKLFTFEHNPRANEWQIASRGFRDVNRSC